MQLAIINALLATLTTAVFGAFTVWFTAVNPFENVRRREQGLPPAPLWYEALWKRSPRLVLSAVYISLSVAFALYLLDFAAAYFLKLKSGLESPYELYEQCTPMVFWVGCGIWLTPLVAALFVLVRSLTNLVTPGVSFSNPTIRDHFQRVDKRIKRAWMAWGSILGVFLAWRYQDLTRIQRDIPLTVLLILSFLAVALIPGRAFKCPRCGTDLKKLRARQPGQTTSNMPKFWQLWDACPNCHLNFDDPYSSRPDSPSGRTWPTGAQEATRD